MVRTLMVRIFSSMEHMRKAVILRAQPSRWEAKQPRRQEELPRRHAFSVLLFSQQVCTAICSPPSFGLLFNASKMKLGKKRMRKMRKKMAKKRWQKDWTPVFVVEWQRERVQLCRRESG